MQVNHRLAQRDHTLATYDSVCLLGSSVLPGPWPAHLGPAHLTGEAREVPSGSSCLKYCSVLLRKKYGQRSVSYGAAGQGAQEV